MRHLTDHHDGHGLNERVSITADAQDERAGGASHRYTLAFNHGPEDVQEVGFLQFQHGARTVPESRAGILEGALLTILIDRYRCFQSGPFACRENAIILTKLEECLMWAKERAHARARRGVLGKNEK